MTVLTDESEKQIETKYYQGFYEVFEHAVLTSVKPNMILSLSGGWDTRVIAGILAKNNVDLPTMTAGSRLEILVASEVAKALNLKHYSCQGGNQQLRENGFKYVLTGNCFDEVCGGWRGAWATTSGQFEYLKKKYLQVRLDALDKSRREIHDFEIVAPILVSDVLACLQKIPWQLRKSKKLQRWILKTKFPKLYRVRYYNSLLPCFLPYRLHGLCSMLHFMPLTRKGRLEWISKRRAGYWSIKKSA